MAEDLEFQSNCLANVLFHGQNRVSCSQGVNHWIPFTEQEAESQESLKAILCLDLLKENRNQIKIY